MTAVGPGSPATAPPRPAPAPAAAARTHRGLRALEIVLGLVTWTLILSPLVLSLRWPEVVAWFVLTFDFYWFYKALMLTGSVAIAFLRIRRVMAIDWRTRAFALADLPGRLAELDALIPAVR